MNPCMLRTAALVTALTSLPLSNGCMWAPELCSVQHEIERQLPGVDFDRNIALTLGPATLALARTVTGFFPEAGEVRPLLCDVSRVEVAVYEVHSDDPLPALATPDHLEKLVEEGWEMAVRVQEDEERVWLLYRVDDDSVREMFVVALHDDQLVLVKIKGRLEKLIARALRESKTHWTFHSHSGA